MKKSDNLHYKVQLILRQNPHQNHWFRPSKTIRQIHSNSLTKPQSKPSIEGKDNKKILSLQKDSLVNSPKRLPSDLQRKQNQYQQFTQTCLNLLTQKSNDGRKNNLSVLSMMGKLVASIKKQNFKKKLIHVLEGQFPKDQCIEINSLFQDQKMFNARQEELPLKVEKLQTMKNQLSKQGNSLNIKSVKTENSLPKDGKYNFLSINANHVDLQTYDLPERVRTSFNERNARTSNFRSQISSANRTKSKFMSFNQADYDSLYLKKLKSFLNFLFKVNFSNHIYVKLTLEKDHKQQKSCKVYIGPGNNCSVVKQALKRRFWVQIGENKLVGDYDFYWTQWLLDSIHKYQPQYQQTQKEKHLLTTESQNNRQILHKNSLEETAKMEKNRKIMRKDSAEKVQHCIHANGYDIWHQPYSPKVITNHIPQNHHIASKKNLFQTLVHYYSKNHRNPFDFIPKTYHIENLKDRGFASFINQNSKELNGIWIVKPGENTNRGCGIHLVQFKNVGKQLTQKKHENGEKWTYIIQSYISNPFLYNGRKFAIRHYMLVTSVHGKIKAYWYQEGYIRTSSYLFDLEDLQNEFVHLTNDAIQKHCKSYQKYQPANKISYTEFQRYLNHQYPNHKYNFERDVLSKMRSIGKDIMRGSYSKIDKDRRLSNFEIFGLDFMIDRDFKTYLIEVNSNPCLEINCPLLNKIIPAMIENTLRLGFDPLFPPHCHYPINQRYNLSDHYLENLKYQLIFDQNDQTDETAPLIQVRKKQYSIENQQTFHQIEIENLKTTL